MSESKANHNIAIFVLKILFFGLCLSFVTSKILNEDFQFSYFLDQYGLIIFTLLMLINWGLESLKWKTLVISVERIPFLESYKSVLAGLSFGLLTPNRMGNFIGKILYLKPENRFKGTLFAFYGNYAQLIITTFLGALAFGFYQQEYFGIYGKGVAFLPLVFSIAMIVLYFFPGMIKLSWFSKVFSKEMQDNITAVKEFHLKAKVLGIALLRHIVFTTQYLVVFSYSGQFTFPETLIAIQLVFLFTTMVPSLIFGKILVRETVAVLVLSQLGYQTDFIINSVLFIWIVNIALPSSVGAFLLLLKKRATVD